MRSLQVRPIARVAGLHSSFIVADRVEVYTRRAGLDAAQGVRWESDGSGEFTVENVELPARGTKIVLHLKEDAKEFADAWRLRGLVRRWRRLRYLGYTESGEYFERTVEGFHARVVQHECDHLDGMLYPMRIRDFSRFGFVEELTAGNQPNSDERT